MRDWVILRCPHPVKILYIFFLFFLSYIWQLYITCPVILGCVLRYGPSVGAKWIERPRIGQHCWRHIELTFFFAPGVSGEKRRKRGGCLWGSIGVTTRAISLNIYRMDAATFGIREKGPPLFIHLSPPLSAVFRADSHTAVSTTWKKNIKIFPPSYSYS